MIAILLAASAVASGVSLPVGRLLCRRRVGWLLALVPAGLFVGFLGFYGTIEAGQTVTERVAWAPSLGVELTFRLDGFALSLLPARHRRRRARRDLRRTPTSWSARHRIGPGSSRSSCSS